MSAYYNEFDPKAAAWLRELIKAGHIAPGIVDERSIEDVLPNELRGFTQCHFFAGIGGWSYALRQAGWSDDRPVWTGSCPCQPFSAAGKGDGFADERHLWPAFNHLIGQCKPDIVFGEQVASKDADTWIDLVHTDMEALGYAFGAVPFPSAGVGAPHIRDRLYWVADSEHSAMHERRESGVQRGRADNSKQIGMGGEFGGLADSTGRIAGRKGGEAARYRCAAESAGSACGMGDTISQRLQGHGGFGEIALSEGRTGAERHIRQANGGVGSGPTNGFWRDADWLGCRDGKWRPVEPSTFPLAHGSPARVGRLRGYGNAINAEQAQIFIESYLETKTA